MIKLLCSASAVGVPYALAVRIRSVRGTCIPFFVIADALHLLSNNIYGLCMERKGTAALNPSKNRARGLRRARWPSAQRVRAYWATEITFRLNLKCVNGTSLFVDGVAMVRSQSMECVLLNATIRLLSSGIKLNCCRCSSGNSRFVCAFDPLICLYSTRHRPLPWWLIASLYGSTAMPIQIKMCVCGFFVVFYRCTAIVVGM